MTLSAVLIPGLDTNLMQTVREMETSYRARETFFEPSLKATYRKSLESLDASIRESLSRCQHDPSNSLAREYLINAYQSKAEVLASALEFYGR